MLSAEAPVAKTPSQPTKKYITETDIFHSVSSAVIASRLVNKERYPPALAMAVVGEYLRFLLLKTLKEDWNDDILFPSPQVQLAWQQHILSTGSYVDECKSFCGRILHHDPDADLDSRKKRYARTLTEYERVFGSAPRESIWPREIPTEHGNNSCESAPTFSTDPSSSLAPFASSGGSSSSAVPAASAPSRLATSTSSVSLHTWSSSRRSSYSDHADPLRTSWSSRRSSHSDHPDTKDRISVVKKERTAVNARVKEEITGKDEFFSSSSRDETAKRARERNRDRNYDDENNGKYNKFSSYSSTSSLRGSKRRVLSPDHGRYHNRCQATSPDRTFDVLILSSPSNFELHLNVTNSTPISTVLKEYAARRRISHSDICLMYYKDALDLSKTVGDYNLKKGSVLRAVFASKGR